MMTTITAQGVHGAQAAPPQRLGYFDFIDGVRVIAVVSVLLFHADRSFLPGRFVGVDVFFVISGFLITRICLSDRFDFGSFYLSRARRILPAYYGTLVISGIVSLAVLLPSDLISSAKALGPGSVLLQNFVFWKQVSYFSPALEKNPYLHTWSLAVEWQFYLLLPVLIRSYRQQTRALIIVLSIMFVATLVLSTLGAIYKPTVTFYRWVQPIDATISANFSAGVWYIKVFSAAR
ncbi:acyltransferase family protein [Sphingomonas qilianensis]|uniref:Acyltransferase n=1 Tax=Sphingomonas qilianensis TaxID=1736690 RepID=A0ABU9XUH4_9SPHN